MPIYRLKSAYLPQGVTHDVYVTVSAEGFISEINAAIDRDHAMGVQRNVNQTPTIFVTAHGKTEGLPGGGVDYKLLKQYLDYLLRQ